jgi:hypothetical protein
VLPVKDVVNRTRDRSDATTGGTMYILENRNQVVILEAGRYVVVCTEQELEQAVQVIFALAPTLQTVCPTHIRALNYDWQKEYKRPDGSKR